MRDLERAEDVVRREIERLKRRVIWVERAGDDRWRRISFLYRVGDSFGSRLFPGTFCSSRIRPSIGCTTGSCCQCRPDVFEYEKAVLDLLPKRMDSAGYCPFFNLARRTCGIYGVRPFACRIFYNLGSSAHCCQNPTDLTLQLFDSLKPHLERVLGRYQGGYDGFA
ncbi:MAG: YkgJ family cysteine cluster protein [Desulfuromonadales bacterium]|nr:YkgJ family cysteine cluster protein [Desulfuromonadales bacterium]